MDFFSKIIRQIGDFYGGLTKARKAGLIVTTIGVLASISLLLLWAGSASYQTLYSNLNAEDATAIMRLLRDKKIPFKVENDGRTIKIPPEAVYDLRLELASSGYPQSGVVGYEVFDKQSFSTTGFVQRLNQKRALEGELTRTINQLRGVKRSRVHLALPQKSTFIEDQKKPTASVVMDLDPGQSLNDRQLSGISYLVASAVEGMETSEVTILDSNGKILSKNMNDPLAKQTATMLDFQHKMEQDYEKRVEEILTRVVGDGKVVAKVSIDIDFTQTTETQTTYDQEGTALRSQQKENQMMDGSRPIVSGAPGATSNTPGPAPASKNPEVKSSTQKAFETQNFAVPETIRKAVKPSFALKKVSVAVLVDNSYLKRKLENLKTGADGERAPGSENKEEGKDPFKNLWEEEKTKLQALVSSAVGYDKTRNDLIDIQGMEFSKTELEDGEKMIREAELRKLYRNMVQYAVLGLAIALFFIFIVRPFIAWLTDNTVDDIEAFLPKTLEELEKLKAVEEELAPIEEALPVIVDKVDPEKVEGEMIKEKVITLIEKNPAKAAMIVQEWIHRAAPAPVAATAAAAGGKK